MTEHRYSFKLLEQHTHLSRRALADKLGIGHQRANQLAAHGLTHEQADRYAVRLGTWPWHVWPTWQTDELTAPEQGVPPHVVRDDAS